jgi:exopolysaccharide biosynthesis polyprenyl glycosylphosphotransferase
VSELQQDKGVPIVVHENGVEETLTETLINHVGRERSISGPGLAEVARPQLESVPPPRPQRSRGVSRLRLDLAMLGVATVCTLAWEGHYNVGAVAWQLLFAFLVVTQLSGRDSYAPRLRFELIEDARSIFTVTAVSSMAILTLQVVFANHLVTSAHLVRQWTFATFFLLAAHTVYRFRAVHQTRNGVTGEPTLIVGAGRVGQRIAARLLAQPSMGLTPIGFLDKEPLELRRLDLPVLGASWDLEEIVRAHGVERVVITFSTAPVPVVLDLVRRCERLGVTVSSVPRLFESINGRLTLDYSGGIPLLTRKPVDPRGWPFLLKHGFDRVLAAILIVLLLPLFVILALAVWCSVGSPVLFRQTRVGRDGREFKMFKFRSMRQAEHLPEQPATPPDDIAPGGVEGVDRRTRLGTFLRRNSLDELPQLLNVIMGDMSLVGPRPERSEYVEMFEQEVYRYSDRHRVKVGITGWAQINGLRGKTSLEDRAEWDNYYIENWTPWLDLKIFVLTLNSLLHTE